MNEVVWHIEPPKTPFVKFFKTHPTYTKWIPQFQEDVTTDPRRHPSPDRIRPIQRDDIYEPDTYRWRKSDLRIVYLVTEPPKTKRHSIWPLDAGTSSGIRYKKR